MSAARPLSPGYGRLEVLQEVESVRTPNGTTVRRVECRCSCGVVKVYRLPLLRNGTTVSCGCWSREVKSKRMFRHGGAGTPEHGIWLGIRNRCADLSNANYGGRGIRVCARWQESFAAFLEDMGPRPTPKHSIDRFPDNDGNYEPGNCRWATKKEQARNTRVNQMVTRDGETLCIAEWAERYGVSASMLAGRLNSGWEFERAVSAASYGGGDRAFYLVPISKRDANWYREYARRAVSD